jgi:membrane protein implicated in regulation of membrane protease activity
VLWLVVAAAFAVAETMSGDLVLVMLGGGALGAGLVDLAGLNPVGQFLVFVIVSVGLLFGIRPLLKRRFLGHPTIPSGAAALIGREATVVETVDDLNGRVKIAGNVWSARVRDKGEVFAPGLTVRVAAIDGATAVVFYGQRPPGY